MGFPKLQIIFRKRATKCRSLLQKMNYKDKGSYDDTQVLPIRDADDDFSLEIQFIRERLVFMYENYC